MLDYGYILVTFPENYRLYEHVKKTEKDGKTEVKSKTHAAGGNDRQDAYLYGHPIGRRKRYRSPADFFPHLLWLCTDESGDPDNCGCKICSPEDLENAIPGASLKMEKPVKQESEVKTPISQAPIVMARQLSGQSSKGRLDPAQSLPRAQSIPRQLVPTPLRPRRTSDQQIDSQYNTFMYRPGETVWFRRGQAWGLGVVLRRWITAAKQYQYTVQPLSHPYQQAQATTKPSDQEMRPWLAWSVPKFTNDGLNNMLEPPSYANADWHGMMEKRYGTGDMEVDGSILAAKAVDSTYTPFGPSTNSMVEPGVTETHYDGIFLGAEKIWTGDPVRLHVGNGTDIMVVHSVMERKRSSVVETLQQSVNLVGDIYTLTTVKHDDPGVPTPASPNSNSHLPHRLTQDLAFRNARSIPAKRTASYWRLIASQSTLELKDIKGRWYEASLLLPILQPAQFEDMARKGEIQEASLWMNARGDCINSNRQPRLPRLPKVMTRAESRREVFGRSIPADAEIRDSIEPPLPNNVDPALESLGQSTESMNIDAHFETAAAEHQNMSLDQTVEPGSGLEEFMDLDGMEERSQMPGFGQGY